MAGKRRGRPPKPQCERCAAATASTVARTIPDFSNPCLHPVFRTFVDLGEQYRFTDDGRLPVLPEPPEPTVWGDDWDRYVSDPSGYEQPQPPWWRRLTELGRRPSEGPRQAHNM